MKAKTEGEEKEIKLMRRSGEVERSRKYLRERGGRRE